ncbi:MAG: hypothetical protein ACO280_09660 [Pseudohongiellaceae bacterium]
MSRLQFPMTLPLLLLSGLLLPLTLFGQSDVTLVDAEGQSPRLSELDRQYIASRMGSFDLGSCEERVLREEPRVVFRRLSLDHAEDRLYINVSADVLRTSSLVIYAQAGSEWREYYSCDDTDLLPVLAIITTARVGAEERGSNAIRQAVLAHHTQLSSHEPSKLLARSDSNHSDTVYMDFTLSSKHPLLASAAPLLQAQSAVADLLERLVPGDEEYLLQPYLAFSGRFSQYIQSRDSSPVVARRFNPALFYRAWSSEDSWLDLGFAHESNGQRLNSAEAFERERADYQRRGEDPDFAVDGLSRGWDYTYLEWRHVWASNLRSQVKLAHYLSSGPLQGRAEEYNLWEDGGQQLRPRRQYDGVTLTLQYDFNRSRCFLGSHFVCFRELELTQQTGYSALFDNNTTTIEFTSDVFGLPIQLWGRSGYNNTLADYFDYSNSWGLGVELRTP